MLKKCFFTAWLCTGFMTAVFAVPACSKTIDRGTNTIHQSNMITIGMRYQAALALLREAGAREVDMAVMRGHTFELPNGPVLLIDVRDQDDKVIGLEVCTDPDQPRSKRQWRSVSAFDPAAGS